MKIRVGFGFDVHQLVTGRELWLGGIKFEHELGLLGHSDADVLIHAICDALLGAANMRDIGYHFPDTAGEFKNIDSKILLAETVDLIAAKGYKVGNVDATICAERPKLKARIPEMQLVLATSVKIAEVPDNFIIKGFPFSVNIDLKVNGRISRLSNKQRNAAFRFWLCSAAGRRHLSQDGFSIKW